MKNLDEESKYFDRLRDLLSLAIGMYLGYRLGLNSRNLGIAFLFQGIWMFPAIITIASLIASKNGSLVLGFIPVIVLSAMAKIWDEFGSSDAKLRIVSTVFVGFLIELMIAMPIIFGSYKLRDWLSRNSKRKKI